MRWVMNFKEVVIDICLVSSGLRKYLRDVEWFDRLVV